MERKEGHPIIAISYDEEAITKVLTGITLQTRLTLIVYFLEA